MLPAVQLPPIRLAEPMLYAVLRGSATIAIGERNLSVRAGSGIWVPAGELVGVRPGPGATVLPVPAAAADSGLSTATEVEVSERTMPLLLRTFADALGHLDGVERPTRLEIHGAAPSPLDPPPALRSGELQELAEALLRHPGAGLSETVVSTLPGWSVRTVQRRFLAETGWTVAAWLRRQRVRTAAEFIVQGRDLEWIAHRVGYGSLAGFIRAFSEVTGETPGRWRAGIGGNAAGQRAASSRLSGAATVGVQPGGPSGTRRTWTRVNGAHVAVWAASGSSELTIAGRALSLAEGQAVVIPAGTPNELTIPEGSLLLPLGYRSARTGAIGAPLAPATLGGLENSLLLDAVLAAYTRIGVTGVDPDRGFAAALAGSSRETVCGENEILGSVANLFVREPDLRLGSAAARLGLSERELSRIVFARTGEQFAAWQRLLRMTRARNQLGDGETPSEISRELGYAHLPAFSRAFRAVHGAGPAVLGVPNLRPTRAAWGREMRVPASVL